MTTFEDRLAAASPEDREAALKYAPVLQRMVEILGNLQTDEKMKFGEAFEQAKAELQIEVPLHMEVVILTSAFDVIANGRIRGLPDA